MDWISVKNQTPPFAAAVLVWGILEHETEYDIHKAWYFEVVSDSGEIRHEYWKVDSLYDISDVTRWMPLPKLNAVAKAHAMPFRERAGEFEGISDKCND